MPTNKVCRQTSQQTTEGTNQLQISVQNSNLISTFVHLHLDVAMNQGLIKTQFISHRVAVAICSLDSTKHPCIVPFAPNIQSQMLLFIFAHLHHSLRHVCCNLAMSCFLPSLKMQCFLGAKHEK